MKNLYGFLPAPNLSTHMNVRRILGDMSPGCYFLKASNNTFHDLTEDKALPPMAASLLGLGLKFIPTPQYSPLAVAITPSLDRIERDIHLKTFFAGDSDNEYLVLRAKSIWQPPLPPRRIGLRVTSFLKSHTGLFARRRGTKNLTPPQCRLLAENFENLIAGADKNLGPVGIEPEWYIQLGLSHLHDKSTYKFLTERNADQDATALKAEIYDWTVRNRKALTDDETHFVRHHLDKAELVPHGYFYLLIKLHKEKINGRPVCSDCDSLPHALGRWVDAQLQPIVKDQALYFKNSAELKGNLDTMELPTNASLFTYDVVAMYPSINTKQCLDRLSGFLSSPDISNHYGFQPTALIEALDIVMNVIVKQISGIAMGMSPAPTIANLFVAIYEEEHVLSFIPLVVKYLRRFINDGFGIWLHDPDPDIDDSNWRLGLILGGALFYARVTFKTLVVFNFKVP